VTNALNWPMVLVAVVLLGIGVALATLVHPAGAAVAIAGLIALTRIGGPETGPPETGD
jgi:hypothetical protein